MAIDACALPAKHIAGRILSIRGHKVLLDADLAVLYGVATKALVQAVKRNLERFPQDFMLQLSEEEFSALRSQSVTSKPGRGGRRYAPYAFANRYRREETARRLKMRRFPGWQLIARSWKLAAYLRR